MQLPGTDTSDEKQKLRQRVASKRAELEAKIENLERQIRDAAIEGKEKFADDVRRTWELDKREAKERLERLRTLLKDGWEKVSEKTAQKLNRWLD